MSARADAPAAQGGSRLRAIARAPRAWIVALGILGVVDSIYLIYIHYSASSPFCSGVGDCETVNTSRYATMAGVPVAVLGLLAYVVFIGLQLTALRRPASAARAAIATFALAFTSLLFSLWLLYVELFVLHAICPYCVVSLGLITAITVVSVWPAWQALG